MWGKSSEPGFKSMLAEPPAPNPVTEVARMPATSSRTTSSIGKTIRLYGEVFSEVELYLDGEVEGSLEVRHLLTIGPSGKVKANVKARDLVVWGTIDGDVEVHERISIMKGASIVGDIKTAGIVIEDGAYFKGGIDIIKPAGTKEPEASASLVSSAAAR